MIEQGCGAAKGFARVGLIALVIGVSGCAGNYVADPPIRSFDALGAAQPTPEDFRSALEELLRVDDGEPIVYALCDAAPDDLDCVDPGDNPSGGGVGGIILPLFLTVPSFAITGSEADETGATTYAVDFEAYVNGIPPVCDDTDATLKENENGSINIEFGGFYCNWLAIGNVINQFEFSVDRIDTENQKFSGYYKIQFNGTGNAGGSGYYIAYPEIE
ncbi:MAG: hypothetical protein AAF360_14115 [Pseudomonadota bacterium]